jgi:hypothetical protein
VRRTRLTAQSAVAAIPSSFGIRRSISTTSGRWTSTAARTSFAVLCFADDIDAVAAREHHPKPGAHERVVVDDQYADALTHSCRKWKRRANGISAVGGGAVLEPSARELESLPRPTRPVPVPGGVGSAAPAKRPGASAGASSSEGGRLRTEL